jgi:hypothetical protein
MMNEAGADNLRETDGFILNEFVDAAGPHPGESPHPFPLPRPGEGVLTSS